MPLTAIVLALMTLVGQAAPVPAETNGPFVVGVLRRDGLVLPFAAFDGRKWSTPWPSDIVDMALPATFAQIPSQWWGKAGPQTQMTAWLDGARKGPVGVGRPVLLAIVCSPQIMLLTDYRIAEPAPLRTVQPYPKDGLVLAPDQPLERIELVPPSSNQWSELGLSLLPAFDAAEQRAITEFTNWTHPMPRMERLKVPLRIEALYRAPMDTAGWTAYYVETVKQYPPGPDDEGCGLVTSASGWVFDGPPGKRKVELTGRVTYCDRKGISYMLPFGLLRARDRAYWIYQFSSYGLEGYIVARPTPNRTETAAAYLALSPGLCERRLLMRRGRGGG